MFNDFTRAIRLTVLTIAVCVIAYTSLVLASAAMIAPDKRLGSWFTEATAKSSVLGC